MTVCTVRPNYNLFKWAAITYCCERVCINDLVGVACGCCAVVWIRVRPGGITCNKYFLTGSRLGGPIPNPALFLLAGVPLAVSAPLACRRQTFTVQNTLFRVCAVPWCIPRHGARLLLSATVFLAMRRSRVCAGGISFKLARSVCAMLAADATCFSKRGAAFLLAHSPAATAVLAAPASALGCSGALVERAGPI